MSRGPVNVGAGLETVNQSEADGVPVCRGVVREEFLRLFEVRENYFLENLVGRSSWIVLGLLLSGFLGYEWNAEADNPVSVSIFVLLVLVKSNEVEIAVSPVRIGCSEIMSVGLGDL